MVRRIAGSGVAQAMSTLLLAAAGFLGLQASTLVGVALLGLAGLVVAGIGVEHLISRRQGAAMSEEPKRKLGKKSKSITVNAKVASVGKNTGIVADTVNVGVQPRNLSPTGTSHLTQRLSKYNGTEARIVTLAFDNEAHRFAKVLEKVLTDAGWMLTDPTNYTLLKDEPGGVHVRTGASSLSSALTELIVALRESGFQAGGVIGADTDGRNAEIVVYSNL